MEFQEINGTDQGNLARLNAYLKKLLQEGESARQDAEKAKKTADDLEKRERGFQDVTVTTPASPGEEFSVNHSWGRKIDKVVVVNSTSGSRIYAGVSKNTAKTIYLKASQGSDAIVIRPAE